ncbi:ABC transporter ATP-binding protein [Roseisalinus antarcticus]|uniref:sn-glycerol-3-phosphate import ATP-binding protein UgpC n=1 Tax=Roseisalinus antarcticus TaxID=254357 RepID=A0A1Y5TW64_9RHOB|nr:sn-glycerol-3-phosphate ABC transporter ATP-binding protein UgpC [Roseisalinus antarcticus]SLN74880.1 sn-glycerol-3-phosphate import ATP-binding protein UgpC [Roseisalinus antarcticus]
MAEVRIEKLTKAYGAVEVLHGIDAVIADGEFVVLVGPSGCGKSTLLRMIAGLEGINGGTIFIGDRSVNKLPPKERDISMVFQNYALYPHMTVAENMAFSMTLAGAQKADKVKAVRRAAEILDLTELLDRKPRQLSGGQRQRVAMGRSIVRDPAVFLFDEPLSNLDAKLRVQMRSEIKALHRRLGTTMIYVTHDQVEAMTMADRIVVMQAGIIEQIGTPLELYDNPVNAFVAQFIGSPSMNIFAATANGATLCLADGSDIGVPVPRGVSDGQTVKVGKRPEDIRLHSNDGPGPRAIIKSLEPTGAETYVAAQCGNEGLTVVTRERPNYREDDVVRVVFSEGPVHLFDPENGQKFAP